MAAAGPRGKGLLSEEGNGSARTRLQPATATGALGRGESPEEDAELPTVLPTRQRCSPIRRGCATLSSFCSNRTAGRCFAGAEHNVLQPHGATGRPSSGAGSRRLSTGACRRQAFQSQGTPSVTRSKTRPVHRSVRPPPAPPCPQERQHRGEISSPGATVLHRSRGGGSGMAAHGCTI